MAKNIVREVIIALLLCLAILLILAVLMYSYIPNNKVIPEPVSYTVPEEAKKVLEEAEMDSSQVILTYEVNSSDLSTAQRSNNYNPGKVNPFSSYQVQEQTTEGTAGNTANSSSANTNGTTETTSGKTTNNKSSSTTENTNTNSITSGGTYFKDKGTK
ncbi:MAG: hypothetical protein IKF17_01225 [Clostridia bacterium]|nr:hypothetical protein [Clostridia bacterium]